MGSAARRSRHLDLHQPAGFQTDRPTGRTHDHVDDFDIDHLGAGRDSDGGAGGVEGRPMDRPARHGFRGNWFSVPSFVLAYLLIYVFAISTDLLPVQGFVSIREGFWPFLSHIAMPSLALG